MVLSLYRKALILVAVPLVFELSFLVTLGCLLEQVEEERAREAHARDVGVHLMNFMRFLLDRETLVVMRHLTHRRDVFQPRIKKVTASIMHEYEELRVICASDPYDRMKLQELRDVIKQLDAHVETAQRNVDEEGGPAIQEWATLKKDIDQMHLVIEQFIQEQHKVQLQKRMVLANYRDQLKCLIIFGFVVNIVLAVGLALYFNRGTLNRLKVLIENTNKLSKKERLLPPLKGNDELARLDTTFHKMADALEEADKSRQEVEKLKQEFVQMVSHDLRSPLTSLQFFHSLLAEGEFGQLNDDGQKRLTTAQENLDRLMKMVTDLIYVERLESGTIQLEKHIVDIDQIIDAAVASTAGQAEMKSVSVDVVAHDEIKIDVDRDRLIQVVENLLTNAIKFSNANSNVLIVPKIFEEMIEVSVIDSGRGVPQEMQATIFERFRQSQQEDAAKGGFGLGLSIAKSLIELHDGQIGVESKEGSGSRFWFRLPRLKEGIKQSIEQA